MIGIYRIYNLITGQSYIGQSLNLEKRIREHFYHRAPLNIGSKSIGMIDVAIQDIGAENFGYEILEQCSPEELDAKEAYYINLYHSTIEYDGYNIASGGQHNISGSNPNSRLSSSDVYLIREAYNNHEDPNSVYYKYFSTVMSLNSFFVVWEGKSWKNIHMDVYTDANKEYYRTLTNSQPKDKLNFSDAEVTKYRNMYVSMTAEEIYKSEGLTCKFNSFRGMVMGDTYRHLPVYKKRTKTWVYNC